MTLLDGVLIDAGLGVVLVVFIILCELQHRRKTKEPQQGGKDDVGTVAESG